MRLPSVFLCLLPACFVAPLPGGAVGPVKPPPIASVSKLTVTGAGPASGSYELTKVYGDWFVTGSDAHAGLHFDSGMGPRRVILEIEWDGTAPMQTFNAANNGAHGDRSKPSLYLTLGGTGGAQQMGEPGKRDSVTLTITHMDATSIEAVFHGSVTVNSMQRDGNPQWQISGVISLHRAAPVTAPTAQPAAASGAGNCDPAIHDKLVGAEWRSATDCEIKFDSHLRQVFDHAFAPAVSGFQSDGWDENKKPKMGPISSIARHSETHPYTTSFNDAGAYAFALRESANSPSARENADQQQAIMNRMAALMKDMAKNADEIQKLSQQAAAIGQTSSLEVRVNINESSSGSSNFKTTHTVTPLPGGGTIIFIPASQARTGGGADAAEPETKVLLGAWGATTAKSEGKDGEEVHTAGTLNSARPPLSVQNIEVSIRGGKDAAQQLIQRIDWAQLRSLLAGN